MKGAWFPKSMWFSMRKTLIFEVQLENDYKTNAKRLRYFGTRSLLEREHTFLSASGVPFGRTSVSWNCEAVHLICSKTAAGSKVGP